MLGQRQWLWWGGGRVWMALELRHRFSLKTNTPQDDLWSWRYVLRQNWVAFLTWLLIAEFACFPGVNTPTMSCFKLPTVQRLAPKMSECVQLNLVSECKAASTNYKRNVLISFLLGCARLDSAWRNPNTCLFNACRLPVPGEHLVVPQLPASVPSLSSPVADPSSRGSRPSSYRETQYYSAGTSELKITFEKDYPRQSHQLLCTQWT